MLANTLNSNKDYILMDFSKHQPNLIGSKDGLIKDYNSRYTSLEKIARQIQEVKFPILIADDSELNIMLNYINI